MDNKKITINSRGGGLYIVNRNAKVIGAIMTI